MAGGDALVHLVVGGGGAGVYGGCRRHGNETRVGYGSSKYLHTTTSVDEEEAGGLYILVYLVEANCFPRRK